MSHPVSSSEKQFLFLFFPTKRVEDLVGLNAIAKKKETNPKREKQPWLYMTNVTVNTHPSMLHELDELAMFDFLANDKQIIKR